MNETNLGSVFPEVHCYGEEQLGVYKDDNGLTHYRVVPLFTKETASDDSKGDAVKDYYAHETAQLFQSEVQEVKANPAATEAAARRAERLQKADEYIDAHNLRDNVSGSAAGMGVLDVVSEMGIIQITSLESLDLEIYDHLVSFNPDAAKIVDQGGCVQTHYFQDIGRFDKSRNDVFEVFEDLRTARNFLDVQRAMQAFQELINMRHFRRLNQAVTQTVNDCVRVGLGTNYFMDNFITDIGDLIDAVSSDFPREYVEIMNNRVPEIVGRRCAVITDDIDDENNDIGFRHCLMGVYTALPIRAANLDLAIGDKKPFGFISESRYPTLYRALKTMLDADTYVNGDQEFHEVRIETLDGHVIRVHRSLLGDKILISTV